MGKYQQIKEAKHIYNFDGLADKTANLTSEILRNLNIIIMIWNNMAMPFKRNYVYKSWEKYFQYLDKHSEGGHFGHVSLHQICQDI